MLKPNAMKRNDDNHPPPSDEQLPIDRAMSLFVQRARAEDRSYFSDMVRSNLGTALQRGATPEQAVKELFELAQRYES